MLTGHIEKLLRPHQREPVWQLLDILAGYQSAVDLSDTGVGKTFVAAAVACALKLPTLVVCPKIVVSAWHRAAAHFSDTLSVINYEMLLTGRTDFGRWSKSEKGIIARETDYVCNCCQRVVEFDNYTPCYCHPQGIHCVGLRKKPQRLGNFIFHDAIRFLVFDEVHRCGALDSLNADMLIAAKRQNIKMLGLSATAAVNPLNMRALGYNLDLHGDKHDVLGGILIWPSKPMKVIRPNFYRWAARYGCRRDPAFHGFKWLVGAEQQQQVMADMRSSIIPARGVRVRVFDIPGFPKRDITAELYDIDETNKINSLYTEMAVALQRLDKKMEGDKSPESAITKILRARQKIELLKVPVAAELASDYLDKGYSIGIFVNFRQTLDELFKRFPGACLIYGGQRDRDENIDSFQTNAARLIIIMSEAGGVGLSLPDLTGVNTRGGLVMPTDKAVTMRQIFGRFHRDDSLSNCFYRVLLASGTVEADIQRRLTQKFNNLDMLNDGDLKI